MEMEKKEKERIANKYQLIEKIGNGSFGEVYKAKNIRSNEYVAIKFSTMLKNEARIYQYLQGVTGVPALKMFGIYNEYQYIVLPLLHICPPYNIQTNNRHIFIRMIEIIRDIHNHSLLHRDIKPSNFLFDNDGELFIIDFGFAKRYMYDDKHIEEKQINNIIGSLNFVSLNVHKRIEPSRRDDLESCIYVYMHMNGLLNFTSSNKEIDIYQFKLNITNNNKSENINKLLHYVRNLRFNEEPDYNFIIENALKNENT